MPDLADPAHAHCCAGRRGRRESTLARAIGERLGLPVIHLDRFVFGPGWTPIETGTVRARLYEALAADRWVVEGTYPQLQDLTLPRADLTIWIEQPALRRLFRAWRKTRLHRGRPRADRPDGCEEGFGFSYVRTVFHFGRWTRLVERAIRAATPGQVIVLRGDRAVANFLDSLGTARKGAVIG